MMHVFPAFQFATQMLFHYVTMQTNLFAINHNGLISVIRSSCFFKSVSMRKLCQMIFCQAGSRTIFRIISFQSPLRYIVLALANYANKIKSFFNAFENFCARFKTTRPLTFWGTECGSMTINNEFIITIFTIYHRRYVNVYK